MKKFWYAVEKDRYDNDWGTGSFDWNEAVNIAKKNNYQIIAKIDGDYDDNGNPTTDELCIEEYFNGIDF